MQSNQDGKEDAEQELWLEYFRGCACYDQGYYLKAFKLHQPLLAKPKSRLQTLKLLNSLGMELIILRSNYQSPLEYFRRALTLAHELEQVREHARACLGSAICYKELGKISHALIHARQGLELIRDSEAWELYAKLHNVMAQVLVTEKRYQQAEAEFQKALYYAEKAGDRRWLALVYSGQAHLQTLQGNLNAARQTMAQAEAISPTRNVYLAYELTRFADTLARFDCPDEAEGAFQRARSYIKDNGDGGTALGATFYIYSMSLTERGQHQQAVHYLKQALEMQRLASEAIFA